MKKLLFILLLLPFIVKAQVYQIMPQYGYQMQRARIDSVLMIPQDTIRNKTGIARVGTSGYIGNGTYWTQLAGGGGGSTDTTSLSNRINLKLNITDTANIRIRPIAGTNMTITGTYPNLTFNSIGADSTVFYTKFRSDTSRANIYTSLANKVETGSAASLQNLTITGTNGLGHIHLRHQASAPSGTGQSTTFYANSDGNLAWKNANAYFTTLATNANTADRIYTFQNKSYTVADDADLAAKLNITDTANMRLRPIAGTNLTLSGTYPNITFNAATQSATNKQDTGTTWLKSGNNNINAGNFIGSTNNASLRFRTNNTERLIIDTLGGMQMRSLANSGTLTNAFQLANTDGRSYFNINAGASVTSLTLKTNSVGADSMVINDSGLIQTRSNATLWLKAVTSGNNNVVANRCAGCGSGSIFSANVGTSAPIFNMLSTGQMTINGETPAASAALDITSTTRGLLIPRMTTTERTAITAATGLQVYNTTLNALEYWNGSAWVAGLTNGTQTIAGAKTFSGNVSMNGNNLTLVGFLSIATAGSIANGSGSTLAQMVFNSGGGITLSNNQANAVTPLIISAINASSTANIAEFSSSISSTALTVGRSGLIGMQGTNTAAGTTGAQTINKPSGVVNFAAGATTLVVTNSLATTSSIIDIQVYGADVTATSARVTRAAGSFTITLNAAATAETAVSFTLQNIN